MGQVLFGIVMKSSFWLMILATSLYVLVALSLGLFISVATKSQLVANQLAVMITYLPSLLLSDFVFPMENMPTALQVVTKIIPATYYIDILNGIYLRGLGVDYLWPRFAGAGPDAGRPCRGERRQVEKGGALGEIPEGPGAGPQRVHPALPGQEKFKAADRFAPDEADNFRLRGLHRRAGHHGGAPRPVAHPGEQACRGLFQHGRFPDHILCGKRTPA